MIARTLLFLLLVLALPVWADAPITGFVVTSAGAAVGGALVRIQGTEVSARTDPSGRFVLPRGHRAGVTVTAWKQGYLNGGTTVAAGGELVINLKPLPDRDHEGYAFVSPEAPTFLQKLSIVFWKAAVLVTGNERLESHYAANCANCHADTTLPQWRKDAHSTAATNPIVLGMYNGTDNNGGRNVFPGYKLDFPNSAGNCAACHAPAQAHANPWGTDLNGIEGVARHGVFCDVCHKVEEVKLHPEGGYPGVLSLKFRRPPAGEQAFYGPFDDVIAGPDTYAPVFKSSRFCASCHSAKFWGVPIYSEYDEWLASPYAKDGKTCQSCHMAPDGKATHFVPPEKGGVRRDPKTVATHDNPGVRDREFLSRAIKMEFTAVRRGAAIEATVKLVNEKAGHHVPTGVPMRNLILLVAARDAAGHELNYLDKAVVPPWGGVGARGQGNYAGLPGKGFAKILADAAVSYPKFNPDRRAPTPHWRQARIESDNRIPAKGSDVSRYRFEAKPGGGCVTVSGRLIYRRAFKPWTDAKGWQLADTEMAAKEFTLCP
ncbi:MAG: hypothetical protein A2151_05340 [Candidatus Muproteobacteria bacterium RBG_16_65_34]|uniref:Cytochrome c domain-containing protein n=1 Tax=Candidatus Muproteobacteria bacterium RBG_16_65_34 TaxID=1817760 RepID=A0A1F6TSK7_9PROT|nr:MAG: hypothetical protein A2151_05340 [Candidatus Muproteobacteria bacterium RBG_16_65_34]